jgi:hypothetical protein
MWRRRASHGRWPSHGHHAFDAIHCWGSSDHADDRRDANGCRWQAGDHADDRRRDHNADDGWHDHHADDRRCGCWRRCADDRRDRGRRCAEHRCCGCSRRCCDSDH